MGIPIFSVFCAKSHFRTWISDSLWRIKSGYFPHLPFFHKAGNSLPQMSLHCWKYSLWFGWGNYLDWACRRQDTWHPLTSKAADHKQNNDHLLISTCFYCMFPWTLKYNSNEKKKKKKKKRQAWRTQVCPKRELTSGCFSQKIPYCKGKCWSLPACLHCGSRWGRTQPKAAMGLSALGEKSDNKLKPS